MIFTSFQKPLAELKKMFELGQLNFIQPWDLGPSAVDITGNIYRNSKTELIARCPFYAQTKSGSNVWLMEDLCSGKMILKSVSTLISRYFSIEKREEQTQSEIFSRNSETFILALESMFHDDENYFRYQSYKGKNSSICCGRKHITDENGRLCSVYFPYTCPEIFNIGQKGARFVGRIKRHDWSLGNGKEYLQVAMDALRNTTEYYRFLEKADIIIVPFSNSNLALEALDCLGINCHYITRKCDSIEWLRLVQASIGLRYDMKADTETHYPLMIQAHKKIDEIISEMILGNIRYVCSHHFPMRVRPYIHLGLHALPLELINYFQALSENERRNLKVSFFDDSSSDNSWTIRCLAQILNRDFGIRNISGIALFQEYRQADKEK